MLYRFVFFLFFHIYFGVAFAGVVETGVMAMSAAASVKTIDDKSFFDVGGIFAPKPNLSLEKVMFLVDDDMNEKGATKVHLVVVYERELLNELKKMSASSYFNSVKQLVKDHPDKMKIFQWTFVAKKRITKWIDIPYDASFLDPLGGLIFANYNSPGEHRASVPKTCKTMKVKLQKKEFQIVHVND